MNILFLTIGRMASMQDRGIYTDLLRCFRDNGHQVYTVSPYEKRTGLNTELKEDNGAHILHVSTGNITKCGMIEKGISTLQIEGQFLTAIKKHYANIKFDLVLYSTPPITFVRVIQYIKNRDNAKTYLLLKDIFPQNAVDMGILSKSGVKGFIYRYFRRKEKQLYAISDYIGCMSQANVDYILGNNPEVSTSKVEICPNSVEVVDMSVDERTRDEIRRKYDIPLDKKVFVYGGNLGKPQGIDFMIECLKSQEKHEEVYFLIVGDGTEFGKIEAYVENDKPTNVKLMRRLPKEDYDKMVATCDVGMIFLDHRFTIPNFPSRLLSYMQAKIPVLAVTDPNTDIGKVIVEGGFGWWCESDSVDGFCCSVDNALRADTAELGENAYRYLQENYSVKHGYNIIQKRVFL